MMVLALAAVSSASAQSPIEQVLSMISELEKKVIAEGDAAQKAYDEYAEWCEDRSRNLGFEIKTGDSNAAELQATIESDASRIAEMQTKLEELSNDIKVDEADLAAATKIRDQEAADFATEEKELTEVISQLERATAILTREMAKSGAAMLQLKGATTITKALEVLVKGAMLSSANAERLTALVQSSSDSDSDDSDDSPGAPAAAVYDGHSDGIIGVLEGLTEKANAQLDKARKTETTNLQNFEMLKQSLTDEIEFANKDMDAAKKALAESQESKATAEGDLAATSKDLKADTDTKATLHQDCMSAAEEFELSTKSRGEELTALAEAKKVLKETSGGAASQTYSFLQTERSSSSASLVSGADLSKFEAVRFIRDLAKKTKSPELMQLASRMSSAMRLGTSAGEDPFAKVKGLISDMIATLEAAQDSDNSHKAYCDKEIAEATEKKEDLTALSDKLSTKIAQNKAASARLKGQVAALNSELASMAKAKAEADKLRAEENAAYKTDSAEMELGIEGVKKALMVLREYYASDKAHAAAEGAGAGIVGLLEVVESDFTKGLTEMTAQENSAQAGYESYSKQNEIDTASKEQDVKYKTQEHTGLDKATAELSTDLASTTDELNAVLTSLEKLHEMCTYRVEPYAERKARRESEIAGLKQALEILSGEAVLMQMASKKSLRGVHQH
jgi:chromosome segregation ATPase